MFLELGNRERPTVLVVDDDARVAESLADLLRRDFHVLATTDTSQALDLLGGKDIALILTDQRMPVLTGSELLAKAAALCPNTVRVLCTAYSDIQAVIDAVNEGHAYYYVTKPWHPERLIELIRSGTRQFTLTADNARLVSELAQLNSEISFARVHASTLEDGHASLQQTNQTLREVFDQLNNSFWHLKKIQEVLPICMDCGKVKSTAATWESVGEYLRKNSLFLSHGYCPECAERLMSQTDQA